MTDVVRVAIVAAIPSTIAALVAGVTLFKQKEIHTLVNSNLDSVRLELAALKRSSAREIRELKREIKELLDARNSRPRD